jgi:hypothetical protein
MNIEGRDLDVIWEQNPGTCLEGMREPTNTFNQDSQSLDRDSNPRPPKLEASANHWTAIFRPVSEECTTVEPVAGPISIEL